ncbi:MAG: alpha/beta fold hydrolase [Desulfomonilaceae bacterium]
MPFVEINGLDLYYEIHGHGMPILMLHHGFGCSKMWGEIVPELVENGYKVICYDRRGYGQSNGGKDFLDFYVSDQFLPASVSDLESFRHWLGIDSFYLVGQCEGGVIAADYAVKYPDRVKNIVISSTLCYSACPMSEFNFSKFTKSFDELDESLQNKLTMWHGDNAKPFFEQFRNYGGAYGKDYFDLRPTLSQVGCSTLVLYPDRSYLFEVEQGVAFYRSLPRGELAVIPDCGHNTYDEQPEEYVSQIVKFFSRCRGDQMIGISGKRPRRPITCAG